MGSWCWRSTGYLLLQGLARTALFVFVASAGGWFVNGFLKECVPAPTSGSGSSPQRRDVPSFPSGHALTSAAVYLTLGALLMRVSERARHEVLLHGGGDHRHVLVGLQPACTWVSIIRPTFLPAG